MHWRCLRHAMLLSSDRRTRDFLRLWSSKPAHLRMGMILHTWLVELALEALTTRWSYLSLMVLRLIVNDWNLTVNKARSHRHPAIEWLLLMKHALRVYNTLHWICVLLVYHLILHQSITSNLLFFGLFLKLNQVVLPSLLPLTLKSVKLVISDLAIIE